jgi:tRNA(Ile)-lysidine synthase
MTPAARRGDDPAGPLSEAEVTTLLAPVATAPAIVLAVSGGADSLALLAAIDRWRRVAGRPAVTVLTVDHGLAAGSDAVAAGVVTAAGKLGLVARILPWQGPKPTTGIEAAARLNRYRLLAAAARAGGATHILTAHSLEDQAETFLMRLERGSGVFGLAAMRSAVGLGGVTLFRPFLSVPRTRLAATTRTAGLIPHDDPMNADQRYLRVRIRNLLPALAAAGIDAASIAATAARLASAADAIDAAVDGLMASAVRVDRYAVVTVAADALATAPAEVRFRLAGRLLQAIGGEDYPPRAARVEGLLVALLAGGSARRTLAGVVAERRGPALRFYREAGRGGLPPRAAPPGFAGTWDHRFHVEIADFAPEGLTIAGLGGARPEGLARPAGLPAPALSTQPAILADGRIAAVPGLGWFAPGFPEGAVGVTETVSRRLQAPPRFPSLTES